MNIILWIIFGGLVGWVASILMKTRRRGLVRNIVIGLIGALLGGFIGSFFGIGSVETFTWEGFFTALGGAILLIWLLKRL